MKKVEEGKAAPNFTATIEDGSQISLKDLRGKKVILFFYPQDNTPTCTVEACNLRDNYKALKEKGFEVIGISADSERKHQNFIGKHELPYHLIADTDRKVIEAFGVWGEKKSFGKTYDGIHRTTYVIDENGVVEKRLDKVQSKQHAQQILEALEQTN